MYKVISAENTKELEDKLNELENQGYVCEKFATKSADCPDFNCFVAIMHKK